MSTEHIERAKVRAAVVGVIAKIGEEDYDFADQLVDWLYSCKDKKETKRLYKSLATQVDESLANDFTDLVTTGGTPLLVFQGVFPITIGGELFTDFDEESQNSIVDTLMQHRDNEAAKVVLEERKAELTAAVSSLTQQLQGM